jgi:hypothetical protein
MFSKDEKKKVSEPSSHLFVTSYVENLGLQTPEDIKRQTMGLIGLMAAGKALRRGR